MIYEETKSGENVIKISSDGDVARVATEGLFVPLGIDEIREVFHYCVDNVWYEWEFCMQTPRSKHGLPRTNSFTIVIVTKVGDNWYTMDDQLVSQLTAANHDQNYAHQNSG